MHINKIIFTFLSVIALGHFGLQARASVSFCNNALTFNIVDTKTWVEVTTVEGVKIEYKFEECNSSSVQNQVLLLLRFTNLTQDKLSLSWTTEIWRNNTCYNCHRLDNPEYTHTLVLNPGEIAQGSCDSKDNKSLYIFSSFVELSPGMTDQKLTDFKLNNLSVTIIK